MERVGKETRAPALIPQNPQAAGKDRRRTDGPAGRVSSLADRGQELQTSPMDPVRSSNQTHHASRRSGWLWGPGRPKGGLLWGAVRSFWGARWGRCSKRVPTRTGEVEQRK